MECLEKFVGRCMTDLELAHRWSRFSKAAGLVVIDRLQKKFHLRHYCSKMAHAKREKDLEVARVKLQDACAKRGIKVPPLEIKDLVQFFVRY